MTFPPEFYTVAFRFLVDGERRVWQTVERDLPLTLRDAVSIILEHADDTTRSDFVSVIRVNLDGRADCTVLALTLAAKWHEDNDSPVPWWLIDYASEDAQANHATELATEQRFIERREVA